MTSATHHLTHFRWLGTHATNGKQSGSRLAFTKEEVREYLASQCIYPLWIKKKPLSLLSHVTHRVRAKDLTIFTRQIATMLVTGVPLMSALHLINRHHNKAELHAIVSCHPSR